MPLTGTQRVGNHVENGVLYIRLRMYVDMVGGQDNALVLIRAEAEEMRVWILV
jgi:hypothetical protein